MYDILNSLCEKIKKKNINQIYIYPYGNMGMEVHGILEKRYGLKNINAVDDGVHKYNSEIMCVSDLKKADFAKEDKLVVLASNNPLIYTEIRIEIKKHVPEEYIFDLFDRNPLCCHKNARIASLGMVSKEIYRKNIEGQVAEAGVYKGEFAKWINILFPDRKLFLVDSFDGFDAKQVKDEDNHQQTEQWIDTLKDTSVSMVMDKMKYRDNVVIKKGYVPDVLTGLKGRFAFVSLDMDIYYPTYEALKFFWTRLSDGGYIFVHDFGCYDGVKEAVTRFCSENNLGYFCLTDQLSVVLAKSISS